MATSLELREVRKVFGDFVAVDSVSFAVPEGTVFGLLGPNGAGKTTTIRMIMDILAPDRGEILFAGRARQTGDLATIGYLPEERGLYRKMTVLEHLSFQGELAGLGRRLAAQRAAQWLERFELGTWGKSKIEALSKGMQQKIQIAGTLLHEPAIVILDEPFSGLDPLNQILLKDILGEVQKAGGTILFSTHVMEHAEKLCQHVCLISQGRVVLDGELAELKRARGGNVFRLVADGDCDRLSTVAGIQQVVVANNHRRLFLAPGVDGADVLRELVSFLQVREFRSEEPDLEALFIQAVQHAP